MDWETYNKQYGNRTDAPYSYGVMTTNMKMGSSNVFKNVSNEMMISDFEMVRDRSKGKEGIKLLFLLYAFGGNAVVGLPVLSVVDDDVTQNLLEKTSSF